MKISEFITNRHKYKVDETYQRPGDVWSNEDNQCLIDSILKNEPIPLFFFNLDEGDGIYYIVDGQQRLNAIQKFYDNKIKLNGKFSEGDDGKTFGGDNPVSDEQRQSFLDYQLNVKILENYDDERIRLIFSRLQRGKPLTPGERLNAMPGEVVIRMREIANHKFLSKSIGVGKNRYGTYPDAARLLFYEKHGARECGVEKLRKFFSENENILPSDKEYKNVMKNLNFLEKCFPATPGDYKYLEKHAWVMAVYTAISEMKMRYSLIGHEEDIKKRTEDFHSHVYSESYRASTPLYQRFYDNVRGGWSQKIIELRRHCLIKYLLEKIAPRELAYKRQISNEEKIAAYAAHPTCQMCRKKFKDYKEPEYHHTQRYADGGESDLSNIEVLCCDCHKKVHGKGEINIPSEEEKIEEDV